MTSKRGIALVLVLALVAVFVPVLLYLSQTGSSQVRQAMKFHEVQQSESVALSGTHSGLCRLRGNLTGLQQLTNLLLGDITYDLTIKPTGQGVVLQNLYHLFSRCALGRHSYILMSDAEQLQPDPDPPVMVLSHDTWNTVEPYDINLAADVTAMENLRGQDLLGFEATKNYERSKTPAQYESDLLAKQGSLPDELKSDWSSIVGVLKEEKLQF
ncbi:MAG TPA: hypothetical protein VIV61_18750 [Candidatus Ozemobacteraceae bacterium]